MNVFEDSGFTYLQLYNMMLDTHLQFYRESLNG